MTPRQQSPYSPPGIPAFTVRPLNTVGFKETPDIPPHRFPQRSFFYLISGEALIVSGETSYLVRGHEFMTVPADIPFFIKWYRNSVGYMGSIDENLLKDRSHEALRLSIPVKIRFRQEDYALADELFFKLARSAGRINDVLSCMDLIFTLTDSSISPKDTLSGKISSDFLDMVFDRSRPIENVSSYASEIGVTSNHLNRTVKAHTGRSAGEWIGISRITMAKELLSHKEIPIIDIAYKVGIEDQSYFARFFRKSTGQTPSEFRKGEEAGKSAHDGSKDVTSHKKS